MKLKDLKDIIHTDLKIIDHSTNESYDDVWVEGNTFKYLQEKEVIGLRTEMMFSKNTSYSYLLISVK